MLRSCQFATVTGALLFVALCPLSASAQVKITPVLEGLDNPSGLCIHGKTGHLFVATHPAVLRVAPTSPAKKFVEVDAFKTDIYGKGPKYDIGPLGVALLGEEHLIVGDGSLQDAEELVRVFKIGANPPTTPTAADNAAFKLGPIGPGDASAKGEGNFYAIAVGPKAFYVTSNGDDTKGWILKCDIKDGKPGNLEPFIATKPLVNVDAPVGITLSPDGKQLVVGQMGEVNIAGDSLLCFYNPDDGKLLKSHATGLNDIAGLAYSPKTGKLYAVDYSWVEPKNGGLFRLDITADGVKAVKIAGLDKPTALAFYKEGNLYVTVFGTVPEGSSALAGSLVKIAAGL
ncbi:MAG: hypothetical protein EHM42_15850 [Planctomycetaceae bacterium]|nr:MAG: hypothetical protein EHM42_15850 [Planctomycetaceae bacterium]